MNSDRVLLITKEEKPKQTKTKWLDIFILLYIFSNGVDGGEISILAM